MPQFCLLILFLGYCSAFAQPVSKDAASFLNNHCVKCHGPDKQLGSIRLDDLAADPAKAPDRWLAVRDQVRDGLMPPAKESRPEEVNRRAFVNWVTIQTGGRPGRLPNQGNEIPHELLFGKTVEPAMLPMGRIWRLSPEGYMGFVRDVFRGRGSSTIIQPFSLIPERGIKDFASLYSIDEPTTEILLRNAEAIVEGQTGHTMKDGKLQGLNDSVREFVALMDPMKQPTRNQLETAITTQYRMALGRQPSAEEIARFLALYEKCSKVGDRPAALKTMLQAVLLRTDAMFRSEMGGKFESGRLLLAPQELATALSLALGDRREPTLMQAATKGELDTRQRIADHVRRQFDDPKKDNSRILRFFRQYFEYARATDVFKDKPKDFSHQPQQYVADTDRLVLHILAADKDVFRNLLTTPESYVNYAMARNKKLNRDEAKPGVVLNPNNDKGKQGVEYVYGVKEWPNPQPTRLPENTRLGILMQPSWLVAFSTNFENDPVRRARWIRERLLGGTVPELPIGVAAQVPDEPHRTLRDRLTVTRDAKCWKCHQKMDELGLPFEHFDHFGRFRTSEKVLDPEATQKNVDKKGKPLGPVHRETTLVTTGTITDSGEAALDGTVKDPRELVRRIAASTRARQVFVRHVFRFFLGRNETLADAKSLQEADAAYVQSGGSFKALVVSLLTSDSFLYRSALKSTGDSK